MGEQTGSAILDIASETHTAAHGVLGEGASICCSGVRSWLSATSKELPELARSPERRAAFAAAVREYVKPPPRWAVGRHRRERRSALFRVPLQTWREVARERGGGINELYLALVARSLKEYLSARGAAPQRLRVAMPVSLRNASESQHGGNVTGLGVLDLSADDLSTTDLRRMRRFAVDARLSAIL